MSASQDKKQRQQQRQQGTDKRKAREEAARKAKHLNRLLTIIGSAVAVVFVATIIIFSSNWLYRTATAVKVNDTKYSIADFNYYFNTEYYQYYSACTSQYGDYASYFLPDSSKSFASQTYADGMSWADYFEEQALTYLKEVTALYDAAKASGFVLPEDAQQQIETNITNVETAAANNKISVAKYYAKAYGKGVDARIYRRNLERVYYATYYAQQQNDSYTYGDDAIKSYYSEHANDLDQFTYRYYLISSSGLSGKENDADADLAAAEAQAKEFAAAVTDDKSFADQAYAAAADDSKTNYEDEGYTLHTTQGTSLNSEYKEWLTAADRKEGDVTYIQKSDKTGYYVVYYSGRDNNQYETVNVRHLLVSADQLKQSDYNSTSAYEEAQEAANAKALETATKYYDEWKAGAATEDSFAALAKEHSEDTGSGEGGLYSKVHKGQMQTEFNDWCFDTARKAGDTDIIHTTYGYHVMYYVGTDELYCDALAENAMRSDDFGKWKTDLTDSYKSKTTLFFSFAL